MQIHTRREETTKFPNCVLPRALFMNRGHDTPVSTNESFRRRRGATRRNYVFSRHNLRPVRDYTVFVYEKHGKCELIFYETKYAAPFMRVERLN